MKYARALLIALAVTVILAASMTQAVDARPAAAQTYTVTNTNDSGGGSLRQAITNANNNPGADTIVFDISGSDVKTITLAQALPSITDAVTIDGTTQGSFKIQINGTNVNNANGLRIVADNVTIKGLVINRFADGAGIAIEDGASGVRILGNRLGTDPSGTAAQANANGLVIVNASGNFIGGSDGTSPGGACTGDCNLISGNWSNGIILSNASNNTMQGNFIGVNRNGTGALPNAMAGILVSSSARNTIGGTNAAARNVLSGNSEMGMEIAQTGSHHNTVVGNYIGTDTTGNAPIPNGHGSGIMLHTGAHDNTIGGAAAGAGNVISGNDGFGIFLWGNASGTPYNAHNLIYGNRIGVKASGGGALGNTNQGIEFQSNNNIIGGINPGEGNIIANSGREGVHGKSGTGNSIRGNSIYDNARFGINHGQDGLSENDPGDGDGGPNGTQNFPVLNSATSGGGTLKIKGSLNSKANTRYELDFYLNPACDPFKGTGEGKEFVGSLAVTTDGGGNVSFTASLGSNAPVGNVVAATATDPGGNTSEFSRCVTVKAAAAKPAPPQLLKPDNGAAVSDNTVDLDWTDSQGATKYQVIVRRPDGTVAYKDKKLTLSKDTTDPLPPDTYKWLAKACNDAGCSKSPKRTFTVS